MCTTAGRGGEGRGCVPLPNRGYAYLVDTDVARITEYHIIGVFTFVLCVELKGHAVNMGQ